MSDKSEMKFGHIFLLPNLMSIFRVFLTIPIGYYLAIGTDRGTLVCAILIIIAGITDFLDGFLARALNQRSRLGLYLDPLADKLMAIVLVIELIFTRGFPLWMAATIVIRDILIMIGGIFMSRKKGFVPPSFLTGKYYFASLATLIGCYVIRFEFGKWLFLFFTILFLILSFYNYARRYWLIMKNREVLEFKDRRLFLYIRGLMVLIVSVIFFYRLYVDLLVEYLR